jgi:Putative phage serine protease XkdF
VKKLAQNYLMKKYTDSATLEHDKKIKGVHLVESWIKDGKLDKSNAYGLNVPEGTWMGMFKVSDDTIWNDYVKTGKVKGFSVEALLEQKLVKASQEIDLETNIEDLSETEANILLGQIKAIIKKDNRYKSKKRLDMESYSDYPDAVKNAAKRALEWADKNGWGSCGTPVGKQRANQLAKGEPVSVDTIKRIHSFISRHEGSLDVSKSYSDGCAKLMIDAWGGLAGGRWAKSKLRELGLLTETEQPSITSTYPGEVAKKKKKDDTK